MKSSDQIQMALELCKRNSCSKSCPYHGEKACYVKLHSDAAISIRQLEAAQPKWISVEERLPEHRYASCLICAYGFIEVATWALDKYKMCNWFFVDGEYEVGVTHWMPLPKPPEEE